jgi:hypothetical protein
MSRTYATSDEYATWLGEASPPAGAARLLRDASLEVDEMLLTAVYRARRPSTVRSTATRSR